MNEAIEKMLSRYKCASLADYEHALKEIIQEVALLALWRAKFFEHAAFYGGTALRILYGLDRFSEDLDFSLLKPQSSFRIESYFSFISKELQAFGFNVEVKKIDKTKTSSIESAFIKANTIEHLIKIKVMDKGHKEKKLQIKFEIDIDPPLEFATESKYLLHPIPFSVRVYSLPFLFAGKMHALLFRNWKNRVKGRDWYDFIWFVSQSVPLNLRHLGVRMQQSGHFSMDRQFSEHEFSKILKDKIASLDIKQAKQDIAPFLRDPSTLELWSHEFFASLSDKIKYEN